MRISILSYGTRGDVQPYLALALALADAGHAVRLAAPAMFAEMVTQYAPQNGPTGEVEFFALTGDPTQLMRSAAARPLRTALMPGALRMGMAVVEFIVPIVPQLIHEIRRACEDADLVIHTLLTAVIGHQIARELGIRDLSALVFPVFTPTLQFPNPLFSPWPAWKGVFGSRSAAFGGRYHYLTHQEFNRAFWHGSRIAINLLRRRHPELSSLQEWPFLMGDGATPAANSIHSSGVLYGISRHALPLPADWPENRRMTGYWFLDSPPGWQPPEGLVRFLDAVPRPIFIGFGSVISSNATKLTRAVLEALRQTGQRAVLLQGWGRFSPDALPDWVYPVDQVPFDWLFPRVAAVLHHGGMGTTAAALRAGIPQAGMPFIFDQSFWSRQVQHLGVGPAPIPQNQRSAQRMAETIRLLLNDTSIRQTAAQLGEKIRAEDGLENAVDAINNLLGLKNFL